MKTLSLRKKRINILNFFVLVGNEKYKAVAWSLKSFMSQHYLLIDLGILCYVCSNTLRKCKSLTSKSRNC